MASNSTPKPPSQPQKRAPIEDYTLWAFKRLSIGSPLIGIRTFHNGSISSRSIRGLRELYLHSPTHRSGASPQLRMKYQRIYTELALTPGLYCSFINENPIALPTPPIDSFKGDISNMTTHSLTEFLQIQGVSPLIIDDSSLFCFLWLIDPGNTSDVHNDHERTVTTQTALSSLNHLLRSQFRASWKLRQLPRVQLILPILPWELRQLPRELTLL
ncbi:hypothetical protein L218DRAFT_578710 [Marasmius fiardii PR-910]|nr:hypothetical protein L218DRAFT_578710 [Marasmius fiardii PR-910]